MRAMGGDEDARQSAVTLARATRSLSLTHSHPHSHSLSHTLSLTHTLSHTPSLTHTLSHTLSLTHTHSKGFSETMRAIGGDEDARQSAAILPRAAATPLL